MSPTKESFHRGGHHIVRRPPRRQQAVTSPNETRSREQVSGTVLHRVWADDGALARRATLGDRTAFAEIVHRHGPGMFRYAMTMLDGDVHDAEDAVQNALTKAWQHLPRFRAESSLRTWMYRITANEVLALRRRRRPIAVDDQLMQPVPAPAGEQPEQVLSEQELRHALSEALGELPWRQRACWILAEYEEMTYEQIAEALDTQVTVVRGQLHRARTTLATRMARWK
jgi:RNA polymerase sigma-70 factor (ECF subfamily)